MPSKEEITKFAVDIENLVSTTGYNYIEAVVEYCKETALDLEVAVSLISPNLRAKIEGDALLNNLLKDKGARLPI